MNVKYKDIPGFPGYRIGTDGSVWSCWKIRMLGYPRGSESYLSNSWRKLKQAVYDSGHLHVTFSRNGKPYYFQTHRLVLEAFVGSCPEGMECRHFPDRNPANNNLSNLSWGTRSKNYDDRRTHETTNDGERNGRSKLTREKVSKIRKIYSKGMRQIDIAKKFDISQSLVSAIVRKECWK